MGFKNKAKAIGKALSDKEVLGDLAKTGARITKTIFLVGLGYEAIRFIQVAVSGKIDGSFNDTTKLFKRFQSYIKEYEIDEFEEIDD
jgi:hypothetical protein